MTDYQRIFVVGTQADGTEIDRVRVALGPTATVLTAPTAEARRVVEGLGREPVPDAVLAPVRFPDADRGHRLDELVRRHAVADRFRDLVVVADPATVTLLLRALAPDQLPASGSINEVGLPRGSRPVPVGPAAAGGVGLAVATGLLGAVVPVWVLPAAALVVGAGLLAVPRRRHLGEALLIAVGVAVIVALLAVAGSTRFPGAW